MSIIIKHSPAENFHQVKPTIQLFKHPDLAASITKGLEAEGDYLHHIPHEVYTLDLQTIASRTGLTGVKMVGWRYLFKDDENVYHVAEVGVGKDENNHVFHHINTGVHVDNFIKVFSDLTKHEYVKDDHYEISFLRVPSCYVSAIWLKGEEHHHEFIIPLAPGHNGFEAGQAYSPEEFMQRLEVISRELLCNDPHSFGEIGTVKAKAEDLTKIEGIGPKLSAHLQKNGYQYFSDLANSDVAAIKEALATAGVKFNRTDPTTWPEQAALAVAGKWKELKILQDELDGGRR